MPVNPSSVILRCLTRRCGSVATDAPPNVWPVISTPSLPGVTIGQEEFSDTALALFDPMATTPSNQSQVQALSDQFSADYLNWRQSEIDLTYVGLCQVMPQGIFDDIIWDYGDSDGVCRTRISSGPYSSPFQQLGHQIPNPDCECQDIDPQHTSTYTPYIRMYGPPVPSQTEGTLTIDEYLLSLEDGRLKISLFTGPDCVSNVTIFTAWCANCVAPGTITVTIQSGACPGGAVIATAIANSAGVAKFELPPGIYCASASTTASGYLNAPETFTVPAVGPASAQTTLYPDKLVITDDTLGVTCNAFPYGPKPFSLPGATYNSNLYGGSVEFDYPESDCCPGGSVTLWYEFACGGALCGLYAAYIYFAADIIVTNPDVGLQIQCPSNDTPTLDNANGVGYCLTGTPCYPANLLYTYGNGLGFGGSGIGSIAGLCGMNGLYGCSPSFVNEQQENLGCTCPPLANTFMPPDCAFFDGLSPVSRSLTVTQ